VGSATTRYLCQATLLAAAVTAVCAWPAHAWAGGPGLAALGIAAGVCLLGAVIARGAAKALQGLDPSDDAGARGVQAGIAVRLLATLGMTLPIIVWEPVPAMPFAAWLGAHYLAQLALEVFVSLRELGQNHGPNGTPAQDLQPEDGDAPPSGTRTKPAGPPSGASQG